MSRAPRARDVLRFGLQVAAIVAYDASKGWFHRPREAGRVFLGGPDQGLVRLNNLGLRGRDVSPRKDPRTARVLVFGDSFVFGVGVDEEHVFSSQLERLLGDRTERRYQVVNLGVSGYSTDQEYLLYQELGASLQPDIVILVARTTTTSTESSRATWARHAPGSPAERGTSVGTCTGTWPRTSSPPGWPATTWRRSERSASEGSVRAPP
jgi:hypothetical protein